MLFKRRVAVADYCTTNLAVLFSTEREAAWGQLLTSCNDPHLNQVDKRTYYDNVRAVIIELMLIAMTKTWNWKVSSDGRVFVMKYLEERGLTHIASLQQAYNRAFGTPSPDGVAAMVQLFANQLNQPIMGDASKQRFYVEFYGMLRVFYDDFKSIKLIPMK